MGEVDLNLLEAMDALLAEGSVTRAARRLGLSASAMSRTLARLRIATGDPLLVRAGRRMVATPRAMVLRDRVHDLAEEVRCVLRPPLERFDVATIERTFTIRANEGFIERFATTLVVAITSVAPHVCLRFAPKPEKSSSPLRDGDVDIEIGVLGEFAPEIRGQAIFRDRFVGVARPGHPLLSGMITPQSYASAKHVVASRRGAFLGPVDDALEALGLRRATIVVVPGFADALRIASRSDLVALAPRSALMPDWTFRLDLVEFELPVRTSGIVVSAMWHPRMEADAGHRWFRETVIAGCRVAARSIDQEVDTSGLPRGSDDGAN